MLISISQETKVYIVHQAVDFRNAQDGLSSLCRNVLFKDPQGGAVFAFRNKSLTAIKLLYFDGQGMWLAHKKLERGKFQVWSKESGALSTIEAHELLVLLKNGNPFAAKFQPGIKPITLT